MPITSATPEAILAAFRKLDTAEKFDTAADIIDAVMTWSTTEEGQGYWSEVFHKLKDKAYDTRKQESNEHDA